MITKMSHPQKHGNIDNMTQTTVVCAGHCVFCVVNYCSMKPLKFKRHLETKPLIHKDKLDEFSKERNRIWTEKLF